MTSENSLWESTLKPIAVLLAICLVAGLCLASVNYATADTIAANEEAAAQATYLEALPDADSFTKVECDIENVTAFLQADNGTGYVIATATKGYGGSVPAVVSFDNDGNIIAVVMASNSETAGMGQRVRESSFTSQFAGLPAQEIAYSDIDAITGATISSTAALGAINLAIQAYNQVVGGN